MLKDTFQHAMSFVMITLCACAGGDVGRIITPQDTTWIQKGQTTREQIIERYGLPSLALPSEQQDAPGEYALYGEPRMLETYDMYGLYSPFEPRPRGPDPQVYRPPIDSIERSGVEQPFWLFYDSQGVVQDHGFGLPPTDSPEDPRDPGSTGVGLRHNISIIAARTLAPSERRVAAAYPRVL